MAVFSPDGQSIATASEDQTVKVWDQSTGDLRHTLQGHAGAVTWAVFSPDGRRIATACRPFGNPDKLGEVKMWDLRTGQELFTLKGLKTGAESLAFNADGTQLVTWAPGHWPLVWDSATGNVVKEAVPAQLVVSGPRSPDGQFFAHPDRDLVRLLRIPDAEEMRVRRSRTRLTPLWHKGEAASQEKQQQWLAAAFHLEQALAVEPTDGGLSGRLRQALSHAVQQQPETSSTRRRLALAQLHSHQDAAFRQTCQEMQEHFRILGPLGQAGFAFQATPSDRLGALLTKVLLRHPGLPSGAGRHDQLLTVRTSVLRPDVLPDPESWLPLIPESERLLRGAVLCRAGRYPEAVKELESAPEPFGLFFRALAEHGRGNLAAARTALDEALKQVPPEHIDLIEQTPTPWLQRVEFEILRREVEASIK
jgi:hypothetical protein